MEKLKIVDQQEISQANTDPTSITTIQMGDIQADKTHSDTTIKKDTE